MKEKLEMALAFAKEHGLRFVEVEGIKIYVPDDAVIGEVPEVSADELMKPVGPFDDLSEEEILFYATPYFEELQAMKAQQKERKERPNE
jgi:hypothetical protein